MNDKKHDQDCLVLKRIPLVTAIVSVPLLDEFSHLTVTVQPAAVCAEHTHKAIHHREGTPRTTTTAAATRL